LGWRRSLSSPCRFLAPATVLLTSRLTTLESGPLPGVDTERGGLQIGVPYRLRLYTHCGIDFWTRFDGSYWNALGYNNRRGNPPDGLGNPSDPGVITLVTRDSARYVSESGLAIDFVRAQGRPAGMVCY
jgi:hypothetical protein